MCIRRCRPDGNFVRKIDIVNERQSVTMVRGSELWFLVMDIYVQFLQFSFFESIQKNTILTAQLFNLFSS